MTRIIQNEISLPYALRAKYFDRFLFTPVDGSTRVSHDEPDTRVSLTTTALCFKRTRTTEAA